MSAIPRRRPNDTILCDVNECCHAAALIKPVLPDGRLSRKVSAILISPSALAAMHTLCDRLEKIGHELQQQDRAPVSDETRNA